MTFSGVRFMAACFAIAALATVLLGLVSYRASQEIDETSSWIDRSQADRAAVGELLLAAHEVEGSARGFALTGDDHFLEALARVNDSVPQKIERARRIGTDDPSQAERFARLADLLREKQAFNRDIVAARRSEGFTAASALVATGRGRDLMARIRTLGDEILAEESRVLAARLAYLAASEGRAHTLVFLVVAAAFVTLTCGYLAVVRALAAHQRLVEQVAAERGYARGIVDTVREPLLVYDEDIRLAEANAAYYRVFGGTPAEAEGKLLAELAPGQPYLARLVAALQRVITHDEPVEEFEITSQVPGVGPRQMLLSGRRLEGREKPHLLLTVEDVTDRRRVAELEVEQRALERTNRELQEFAYVASHDLQEPLRKMRAFAERLNTRDVAGRLPDDVRDYLARIASGAERMQRLIDDLLAFSRVTTKAAPFAPVELGALVREVVADLEPRLEATGGRIEIGPLPSIEADRTQLRQLFQNLLVNALKFHRPGVAPSVQVSAIPVGGASEGWCEIHVADNGIGFDEKYLDRIFTIFQRLHRRNEYEGTGLGLAICRKVVERHGGRITARSTPGEGATFIVRLPLRPAKAREAA